MGKGEERREEQVASRVVEHIEKAKLKFRDGPSAEDGTHDYDLFRFGQLVGAVEVTMLMDESRQALSQAIAAHSVFPAPELSRNWYLNLRHEEDGYNLPKMKPKIVVALAELEEQGLHLFEPRPWHRSESEPLLIEELPARSAASYERDADGGVHVSRVILMPSATAAIAWSGNTHEAIQDALTGSRFQGERAKLLRAGTPERHLFAWIDPTMFEAYFGLADDVGPLEERIVSLPPEVTTLWVGAPSSEGIVVWRAAGSSWERFVVERSAAID